MKKKNSISKLIAHVFVGMWIAFSLGYIAWDQWSDFKAEEVTKAEDRGFLSATSQVVNLSNNPSCQPFTVGNESTGEAVQLINIACLQQTAPAAPSTVPDVPVVEEEVAEVVE